MKKRLILDEKKFVEEQLLINGLSDYIYLGDIKILIKYWRYLGVNDKKDLLFLLSNYLKKFYPNEFESINKLFPVVEDLIYKIISETKSQKLRVPVSVPVTENELNFCRKAKNYNEEKLLFTMLVLSKYYELTSPVKRNSFIPEDEKIYFRRCYLEDSQILKFSKNRDYGIFRQLIIKNLINRIDERKTWFELKIDYFDNSPIKFYVKDIANFLDYYPVLCEDCGREIQKTGSRKIICSDCRVVRERKRSKLAMQIKRNSLVTQ